MSELPDQQAHRDQWLASVRDTAAQARDVAVALRDEGFTEEQIGVIVGSWWGHSIQASHAAELTALVKRMLGDDQEEAEDG